jgi:hypothetical protein
MPHTKKPAKKPPKATKRKHKADEPDFSQSALAVVEKAIGGKLADGPITSPVNAARSARAGKAGPSTSH